ncbi:hypothetical protein I4U23_005639 [Adineta vaga]|nr:hypothetical protein I4U23_005639 [Adineta vaga]
MRRIRHMLQSFHSLFVTRNLYHKHYNILKKCQNNLQLFDPIRGDIPKYDGGLLPNIADQYSFVVQLSNYTEKFFINGLPPLLIYFNISQIIQCERITRQKLYQNFQVYYTYDVLSSPFLRIYMKNLNKYYDCDDLHF